MRLIVDRVAFLKIIARSQNIVERRNTVPILANVLIDADAEGVRVRATDLDTEIVQTLSARIERQGAATVSAHMLHEIVRKLPEGSELLLDQEAEGQMMICAGRSRFVLPTLPAADFPKMASDQFDHQFVLSASVLHRLLERTRFAMSNEETRYYLNGVYLHRAVVGEKTFLRAVATDGHRLALIDQSLPDEARDIPGVIIPRKTVGELCRMLENNENPLTLMLSESKIRFDLHGIMLTSRLIDGSFPDYDRVIPAANDRQLEICPRTFSEAVDRVATICTERTKAVKLDLEKDRMRLSVQSSDLGSAVEELAVSYQAPPLEIGFNSRYLIEMTSQLVGDKAVLLFSDSSAPVILRDGEDSSALYIVMPMRI